jgi:hypothetical protein
MFPTIHFPQLPFFGWIKIPHIYLTRSTPIARFSSAALQAIHGLAASVRASRTTGSKQAPYPVHSLLYPRILTSNPAISRLFIR